jgi:Tol biopolymer transport system component
VDISPDESTAIYLSRTYDLAANAGKTVVFRLDLNTGKASKIIDGGSMSISSANWRPDGKK